jgi:hypothetical protein
MSLWGLCSLHRHQPNVGQPDRTLTSNIEHGQPFAVRITRLKHVRLYEVTCCGAEAVAELSRCMTVAMRNELTLQC